MPADSPLALPTSNVRVRRLLSRFPIGLGEHRENAYASALLDDLSRKVRTVRANSGVAEGVTPHSTNAACEFSEVIRSPVLGEWSPSAAGWADDLSAIDDHGVPDEKGGGVGAEPEDGSGDLLRLPHPSDRLLRGNISSGHVAAHGERPAAGLIDEARGLLAALLGYVRDRARALPRKRHCRGAADAARRAGHERDLATKYSTPAVSGMFVLVSSCSGVLHERAPGSVYRARNTGLVRWQLLGQHREDHSMVVPLGRGLQRCNGS